MVHLESPLSLGKLLSQPKTCASMFPSTRREGTSSLRLNKKVKGCEKMKLHINSISHHQESTRFSYIINMNIQIKSNTSFLSNILMSGQRFLPLGFPRQRNVFSALRMRAAWPSAWLDRKVDFEKMPGRSGVLIRKDYDTLPETNSLHLKMDGWTTSSFLGWPIFRGYVSFREGRTCPKRMNL